MGLAPEPVQARVEDLLSGRQASVLDALATLAVSLVGLRDARLAQADDLAVDLDGRLTLGVGDLVGELLGLGAHEAVDHERQQIGRRAPRLAFVVLVVGLELVDGLLGEQLWEAVVDGREVAHLFLAGEVLVVLEVEGADELLGPAAVLIYVDRCHDGLLLVPVEAKRRPAPPHCRGL